MWGVQIPPTPLRMFSHSISARTESAAQPPPPSPAVPMDRCQQNRARRIQAALDAGQDVLASGSGVLRLGGIRLTQRDGGVTPAGGDLAAMRPDLSLDPWLRGVTVRGNKEFARLRDGTEVSVAQMVRGERRITNAGRSYFRYNKSSWVLVVPAWANVLAEDGRTVLRSFRRNRDGSLVTVQIPDDFTTYDEDGEEAIRSTVQRRRVYEAFVEWARKQPLDDQGRHYLVSDYTVDYTADEETLADVDNYKIDVQTTHVYDRAAPTVETLLNRPLRGEVYCPAELWRKHGLTPLSFVSLPPGKTAPWSSWPCAPPPAS